MISLQKQYEALVEELNKKNAELEKLYSRLKDNEKQVAEWEVFMRSY
jgi:peptidoglycan hydrolase CwlO-like protein